MFFFLFLIDYFANDGAYLCVKAAVQRCRVLMIYPYLVSVRLDEKHLIVENEPL